MRKTTCLMAAGTMLAAGFFAGCETFEGHEGAVIGSAAAGSGNRGTGAAVGAVVGGVAGGVAGDQLHDKK